MSPASSVALITGATSGIGRATATALAAHGYYVVAIGRDRDRGRDLSEALGERGEFRAADLLSRAAIDELTASVRRSHDRLDLLVNNAGVSLRKKALTTDGIERTFMVNTVAPYLLTRALIEPLIAAEGRVVNVVTELMPRFRLTVDDLRDPSRYSMFRAYSSSKLALMMVTIEQAKRYTDQGVTVIGLHPGVILDTRLSAEMPRWFMRFGRLAARVIGRRTSTADQAAEAILHMATTPVQSGRVYSEGRPMSQPVQVDDEQTRATLFQLLEDLTSDGHLYDRR